MLRSVKKHSQNSDIIKTPEFVERIQNIIDANSGMSLSAIASYIQVYTDTTGYFVHEDIR